MILKKPLFWMISSHSASMMPNHHSTCPTIVHSIKTCALSSSCVQKTTFWRCCWHWTLPSQVDQTAYLLQCQSKLVLALLLVLQAYECIYTLWQISHWMETSSVVPVPRGSNHSRVSNYRPISLLPVWVNSILLLFSSGVFSLKNHPCLPSLMLFTTGLEPWTKIYNEVCAVFFLPTEGIRIDQCPTSCLLTSSDQLI